MTETTPKIPSLKERLSKYTVKPSDVRYPGLVMLYGRPGSGKTWLAASVSELSVVKKVLYIDTEGSTEGTLVGFDDDKIDILNIPKTVRDLNDDAGPEGNRVTEIQFLDSVLNELLATNTSGYDAIVIDTLDVAQDWKVKELTPIWESKNKYKIWDLVSDWTEDIGQRLKSLDAIGVIVLHSKKDKDESSGTISIEARLKGSSRETFPGIPDTVAHLTRRTYKDGDKEVEATVAEFATQDNKVTKNRFDFPTAMVAPSFEKMWNHIDNRQKENN